MRPAERYQISLILLGIVATLFFGVFLYRELFPEYKIYQNDYIALEQFRSSYTGEPAVPFQTGIKQIVLTRADNGPPTIDRCISCHVALQISDYSPTKIVTDEHGNTVKMPNENYIWKKLDDKIADLKAHGEERQAAKLESLKTAEVDGQTYDMKKVLVMHPLIGKETRPFQFHPIEEYGCVSCHNGNGRALTTDKAHGPIFDETYDITYQGPHPQFLETDVKNDPAFAKMFNHKPGDALIFQTTPLYLGSLIEAKCVQCHRPDKNEKDSLFKDFIKGEELYISQACYACHRIAGFSRGGVGPDLTHAATIYPWYMKQKISWPQGDLPTSTMPNYKLDHPVLEDLMTFLLAQTGEGNKTSSEINYKTAIQAWEAGQKQPWEQPIAPTQMLDLRYAMTVFATEGCSACHRLKGFESDVGFAIEKEQPSFEALYQERQWFSKLFYENIPGSEIVQTIDQNAAEIDKRIVDHVRNHSILEEIDGAYPDIIEALYANFAFANRAKNDQYKEHPEQLKQWQERIRRVLMAYIQEYGLGRLVGPRPNWSGVYRSDQWLMEHFHNPGSHVPRSIMPVFPFDDTKFYALTHMLDVLGIRNRNAVQEIWKNNGFDPALAAHIYCSQCHGEFLLGNGPVAEWIYPIPKNLKNADFLRNMTKEKITESITHGVLGTPMPPWGVVAADKPNDGKPVLNEHEIKVLVDWLFASVPGGTVIRTSEEVPKWQYTPQKIEEELVREGNNTVTQPFNEINGQYYLKKELYTPENIERGKDFFELNCAVCHGTEGDGSGVRAEIMQEAKPRMLTNLDWAASHDDLYILRSIKYGVPGTSMTPWGDLTSSTQRIQLVTFIRSLSQGPMERERLLSAIYKTFDTQQLAIEKERLEEYQKLAKVNEQINELKEKQKASEEHPEEAVKYYQQILQLKVEQKKQEAIDRQYLKQKELIKQEADLYKQIGIDLLNSQADEEQMKTFVKLLDHPDDIALQDQILNKIEKQISLLEEQKITLERKFATAERNEALSKVTSELTSQKKLLEGIKKNFLEASQLQQKSKK